MHSVSMFTVLSYCCRTILCDNAVAKCVQSVDTQLPLQHCAHYSYVTAFYVNTMAISISTVHAHYGPPGESGQHQQVVKLYSHSTKQIS